MDCRLFTSSLACLTLVALPAVLRAQRGTPQFDGPRGAFSFQLSDGEPVSFYFEYASQIELDESQKKQLMEIRRRLRAVNAPFMKQLDSLREYAGVDMTERRRLSPQDGEALQRFRKISQPVTDSIRANNDIARGEIRLVLADRQLAKADSIAGATRDPRGRRPGPSSVMRATAIPRDADRLH